MRPMRRTNQGFTVVELMTSTILIGIVLSVFMAMLITTLRSSASQKIQLDLSTDAQQALNIMERDVRFSFRYNRGLPTPQFEDPYGANNVPATGSQAWSYKGVPANANSRALLLSHYATTQNSLSNARTPIYNDDPGYDCGGQLYYNSKREYIIIYFVRDNTLFRRIITDEDPNTCGTPGQVQKQSCPTGSSNSICEANDEIIANNVDSLAINYYEYGETTPIADTYSSSDPTILDIADEVEVALTLAHPFGTGQITQTLSFRVAKVNI